MTCGVGAWVELVQEDIGCVRIPEYVYGQKKTRVSLPFYKSMGDDPWGGFSQIWPRAPRQKWGTMSQGNQFEAAVMYFRQKCGGGA